MLGELKEICEIEEKVQRIKKTQESTQSKTNEEAAEHLLENGEGILVICDDAQEQVKMGEGEEKEANQ